ncbi:MAG: N-acetylmuramoyl-L-alanine amidase [Candidatus Omnitrophica bacterium]|nr:N-acetylmuramoyl-L-alanine amidase [Candidatus Omnitrophota bacterium]MCM8801948.1 N-acetylmuramoyl-L-alanine amidase [Candidatus Omnitrophota bacterium]
MHSKKFGYIFFFIFLLSLNLFSLNLDEEIKIKKIPTYFIKNVQYISLKSFLKIINSDNWAKIEDRVFLFSDETQIKFRIDDTTVIVGGKKIEIKNPPKEVEGEVLIPVEDFSKIFSDFKTPEKKEETKKIVSEEEKINKKFIIVIDPGHGGHDAGAIGNFGLKEKDVNLDVCLRLEKYLKKQLENYPFIEIYLTRKEDIFISLEERINIAKTFNADIFFSVHTNSSRLNRYEATGFETYYPYSKVVTDILPKSNNEEEQSEGKNDESVLTKILNNLNETDIIDESRILAECVQEKLAERLIIPDRGAKRGNFYVLKYTPMISVLTEIGFICNPNIEFNLKDIEVRQAIAETLGKSIIEYLKKREIIK